MLYAVVARCPVFGGKVASFDATKAKAVPGVKQRRADFHRRGRGGRQHLVRHAGAQRARSCSGTKGKVAVDEHSRAHRSSLEQMAQPGAVARKDGDAAAALAAAAKKIEAVYEVPYLAHAPMEPLNCTADVTPGPLRGLGLDAGPERCARRSPRRSPACKPEQVKIHTHYMGGGFGRRAAADYIGEAVEVSKAVGAPVKLTWSREDDMQQDSTVRLRYTQVRGRAGCRGLAASRSPAASPARRSAAAQRAFAHRRGRRRRHALRACRTCWWTITPWIRGFR